MRGDRSRFIVGCVRGAGGFIEQGIGADSDVGRGLVGGVDDARNVSPQGRPPAGGGDDVAGLSRRVQARLARCRYDHGGRSRHGGLGRGFAFSPSKSLDGSVVDKFAGA